MRRDQLLALSLPSFVFAGYELARKTWLPVLLVGAAHLGMAQAGLILTIVGAWSILVEVLFGMICDLAPAGATACLLGGDRDGAAMDRRRDAAPGSPQARRRGLAAGTAASGDGLGAVQSGAWGMGAGTGQWRGRTGTGVRRRARAGMAGSIAFTLAILWSDRQGGMPDGFHILLILTLLGRRWPMAG
jgi:hypothetical protein